MPRRFQLGRGARVFRFPDVVPCPSSRFTEAWQIGLSVPPERNPFNSQQYVRRRQASTRPYGFSGRTHHVLSDFRGACGAFDDIAVLAERYFQSHGYDDPARVWYHVNWYPDGKAAIAKHADDEFEAMQKGAPILSFTLLANPENRRGFQIYKKGERKPLLELKLGHGEMLVMAGPNMQVDYEHGLKATAAKAFAGPDGRRINVTARVAPVGLK